MPHRLGRGHSLLLSIIQTFRVHQKRTANISNSRTSTNHLGPLAEASPLPLKNLDVTVIRTRRGSAGY
jgi:hypothetical protein